MTLLVDTLARAICRAAGADPDARVVVGKQAGQPIEVDGWVRHRPMALIIVTQMRAEIGDGGVDFVESALGVAVSLKAAG